MNALAVWLRPRRAVRLLSAQEADLMLLVEAIVRTAAGEPALPKRRLRVIQGGGR